MAVELSKLVDGAITQRCRFSIHRLSPQSWQVVFIQHHDNANHDYITTHTISSEPEAIAHVYASLVNHFSDYSVDEWAGGDIKWNLSATDTVKPEYLVLAKTAAAAVMDWLQEELEQETKELLLDAEETIIWGIYGLETGEVRRLPSENL